MYLNFLLHFWSYNNSLKNTVWRSSQLIHAPARNKKSGPLFGRLIYFSLQCSCFFGSERNLLVMFFLPMFVMPWLPSLILFCCWERLRRAAPLGLGRFGRTHKLEGVGTNSFIFYNSTWRYASRRSQCALQRKRLQYTGLLRFFYLFRNFTVNAR